MIKKGRATKKKTRGLANQSFVGPLVTPLLVSAAKVDSVEQAVLCQEDLRGRDKGVEVGLVVGRKIDQKNYCRICVLLASSGHIETYTNQDTHSTLREAANIYAPQLVVIPL